MIEIKMIGNVNCTKNEAKTKEAWIRSGSCP